MSTKAQKIMKSYDRKWVSMRNKNCYDRKYAMVEWLKTAYQMGYEKGQEAQQ